RLVLQRGVTKGAVLIGSGRISQVFNQDQAPIGFDRASTIDFDGRYVAPGLIDLHIHGSAGVDVLAAENDEWSRLSHFLLSQGVTGYFPTFVPVADAEYHQALTSIDSYLSDSAGPGLTGARVLGVHFEGPFVSKERCGALHPAHFRGYDGDPASIELFTRGRAGGSQATNGNASVRGAVLMTIAPEIEGGISLIRDLCARGVTPFIGHSVADLDVLDLAVEAGARHITHFPNALDPLHHRKPGAVGWGLLHPDVSVDCIADHHHVHPLMLKLIYQNKGADRMALISDAIPPAGLGDGEYEVWGDRIKVRAGLTSLADHGASETIAGSVITLLDGVRNTAGLGIPLFEAIGMASLVPARAAGIESDRGSLAAGKRADLIALDEDLKVQIAFVGGQMALDAR
ncbi:MAG: N-acetylglucosamine-6-phosphate deacetylase, partial [Blastocatellia bacterium]